jgi:hypothetical protein
MIKIIIIMHIIIHFFACSRPPDALPPKFDGCPAYKLRGFVHSISVQLPEEIFKHQGCLVELDLAEVVTSLSGDWFLVTVPSDILPDSIKELKAAIYWKDSFLAEGAILSDYKASIEADPKAMVIILQYVGNRKFKINDQEKIFPSFRHHKSVTLEEMESSK